MKRISWIRRRGTRLALAVGLWIGVACSPVFLPLPPPSSPTFSPLTLTDASGKPMWQTTGGPMSPAAGARYYIFNSSMQSGVIVTANADGSYGAPPMVGEQGDEVELHYVTPKGDSSEVLCVKLVSGLATTPCD